MTTDRQLHLNVFIHGVGHHESIWRDPVSAPGGVTDLSHYTEIARIAERGTFDSLFLADAPALFGSVRNAALSLEPFTLLSALAAVTERIGLIGTASTTFTEPYNLARQFASLDHLSRGRAGWNIVTTASEAAARNFGLDRLPTHADRYGRSREYLEVATRLWDSWEPDAVVLDRENNVFADPARVHDTAYAGEYFSVHGPLNVPRSPQGRPVLVQAGSSEAGRDFAGEWAEAIFTSQLSVEAAREFRADIRARATANGRDPGHVNVLPGVIPILGSTEEEARRLRDEWLALTDSEVGLSLLQGQLGGIDLSGHDLDAPFPDLGDSSGTEAGKSRWDLIVRLARTEGLTLREVLAWFAAGHGHRVFVGTPEQLAGQFEYWLTTGASDGFNIMPPRLPDTFEHFVDHVVPILRSRGLFRAEYSGTTLREHYGLPVPANRYAVGEPAA